MRAFLDKALVPYEADEVTRLIVDEHSMQAFAAISQMTVGAAAAAFKLAWLLNESRARKLTGVDLKEDSAAALSRRMIHRLPPG